jgi:hypothetical protein
MSYPATYVNFAYSVTRLTDAGYRPLARESDSDQRTQSTDMKHM